MGCYVVGNSGSSWPFLHWGAISLQGWTTSKFFLFCVKYTHNFSDRLPKEILYYIYLISQWKTPCCSHGSAFHHVIKRNFCFERLGAQLGAEVCHMVLLQITQYKLGTFFIATAFLGIEAEVSFCLVNLQKWAIHTDWVAKCSRTGIMSSSWQEGTPFRTFLRRHEVP